MKNYELSYLLSPEQTLEEAQKISREVDNFINQEGGMIKTENLAKKGLAYLIKKETEAYLAKTNFDFDPEKIIGLKTNLRSKKEILRFLLVKKKAPKLRIKNRKREENIKVSPTAPKKAGLEEIDNKIEEILK